MQQPVMGAAQQHEVLEAGLPAIDPMPDMMCLDIALMRAAREAAAAVVAQLQCPQQPCRHDSPPALVVQQVAPRILDKLGEIGVAGDVAGILLIDAPVGLGVVARAARCPASSLRSMVSITW